MNTDRSLQIGLRANVLQYVDGDEYELRVYSTSNSNANDTTFKFNKRTATTTLIDYKYVGTPKSINMWLYRTALVEPKLKKTTPGETDLPIKATGLIGQGTILMSDAVAGALIELWNGAKDISATVKMTSFSSSHTILPNIDVVEVDHYNEIVQLIAEAHSSLLDECNNKPPSPDRSNFYFVDTNLHRYPITTSAYLSILHNNSNAEIERLLIGLYRQTDKRVSLCDEEVLVDLCTMLTRALYYQGDSVRTNKGKIKTIDQWTQLGMYPQLGMVQYDCEDGAALVLAIVHALRHYRPTLQSDAARAVAALQRIALRYTPFMVLGNLKEDDGEDTDPTPSYVAHCYVVMMDKNWVNKQLNPSFVVPNGGEYYPALTMESTSYCSGVWGDRCTRAVCESDDSITTSFEKLRESLYKTFKACDAVNVLDVTRIFSPIQCINQEKSTSHIEHLGYYQDVYTMMAVDHESKTDQIIHALVSGKKVDKETNENKQTVGSVGDQLMRYSPDVKWKVAFTKTHKAYGDEYRSLWNEQPLNPLPQPSSLRHHNQLDINGTIVGVVDVPSRCVDKLNDKFEQCMERLSSDYGYDIHLDAYREIAKDVLVHRYYFTMT